MSTPTIAGTPVDVDGEGFLEDSQQWNEAIAAEVARANGVEQLTDRHWQVVKYMRSTFLETGAAPTIRTLGRPRASRSRSSTSSSRRAPPSWPPRSGVSRSRAAASKSS